MGHKKRLVKEIEGVLLTPLKIINVDNGNVLHGLKMGGDGFCGFGEAYFSIVKGGAIKAWKRHRKMTLNLMVPLGAIKFVVYDDRMGSSTYRCFQEILLSRDNNYMRITVPPLVWLGFQGCNEGENMLLNITDFLHDPDEVDRKLLQQIDYDWGVNR